MSAPLNANVGLVLVDDIAYLRLPSLFQVFVGAPWVRLPTDGTGDLAQETEDLLEALGTDVPGSALTSPDLEDETFTYLGPERVDGERVERYRVAAPDGAGTSIQDFWVDTEDLLLRVDGVLDGPTGVTARSTVTYDDWGEPVTVQAPPEQEVADLPAGVL